MAATLWFLCVLICSIHATLLPTHVYLSLTGDPSQVQVTFTTTTKPTTAQVSFWSDLSTIVVNVPVAAANIHTFTRPVTSVVNYISTATLSSLRRATYYNYQIHGEAGNTNATSKVFRFKTLPADGQPVSVGIYGDLGAYGFAMMQTGASGLPKYAASGKWDVIIHNGDLAYNLGGSNGAIGDTFMTNLEQISAIVPYVVTPGNHEFMDSGADEIYYNNIWLGQDLLGKNSKSTNTRMWWSFDVGTVHVVGISTEVYCEDTENIAAQYAWLENDLKAADARLDDPFIIVLGHRPLYSGLNSFFHTRIMRLGLQCTDSTLTDCDPKTVCKKGKNCAYSIEDLLLKYHVDMYNSGHQHIYVRNNPIGKNLTYEKHKAADNYVNPQFPLHIVSGAAGTAHVPSVEEIPEISDDKKKGDSPAVLQTSTFSYSTLTAYNNTHVFYQQISAVDGAIIDSFWVIKSGVTPSVKLVEFTLDSDSEDSCN